MIKFVFIDLDDTILDFKEAEKEALVKMLKTFDIKPNDYIVKRYSYYNLTQWKRLERGEITRQQVKINRYKLLFDELGIDISPESATAVYEENLSHGCFFINGSVNMLMELYKSYDLYIVSNGTKRVQEGRLGDSGIKKYFKDIFISEDIGFNKPDRNFFERCFERIKNFDINKAVIIGDSLTSDIKGGINAGIKTIWFNPGGEKNNDEIKPDYEISDLSQAAPLLGKI